MLFLCAVACGQNADERYAGLEVITVHAPQGVGYRLRYLHPPWEEVDDDPLVVGKSTKGQIGDDAKLAPFEPHSAAVLEVEKTMITNSDPSVISYPKYRLEAGVVRCDATTLASSDVCAQVLATRENGLLDGTDMTGFFGAGPRAGTNDADQRYFEVLTKNDDSARWRRLVYFETDVHDLALRVAIEANPSPAEREVTRMIEAVEVLAGSASTDFDAGSADAGSM